jgi:hypothetical protein
MNSAILTKEEHAKANLAIESGSETSAMRKFKMEGAIKTVNASGYSVEQDTIAEEETRDIIRSYHNIVNGELEENNEEIQGENDSEEIR